MLHKKGSFHTMETKRDRYFNLPELAALRMVNPNDILKENTEKLSETKDFKGVITDWCKPNLNVGKFSPRSTARSPRVIKKHIRTPTQKSGLTSQAASNKDPFLIRTAWDYLQRIAFSSYLSHKKTPVLKCSTCDGIDTPSLSLPVDSHKEWALPFEVILPSSQSSRRRPDTESRLSMFNSSDIVGAVSLVDAKAEDIGELMSARALEVDFHQRRCSGMSKNQRDGHESLMQHALTDDLRDYVCFPFTQTKQSSHVRDLVDKIGLDTPIQSPVELMNSSYVASETLFPRPVLTTTGNASAAARPKSGDTYRRRRTHSAELTTEREELEMDFSVQNTVDFFMNMTSPIKTQDILNTSFSPISHPLVRRSLTQEFCDSDFDISALKRE